MLDVGCGSGYTTGLFYALVQPDKRTTSTPSDSPKHSEQDSDQRGLVVGIDHIPSLTALTARNLTNAGFGDVLTLQEPESLDTDTSTAVNGTSANPTPSAPRQGSIEIITGDGRLGYAPRAPYDAIHVGAAAGSGVPPALLAQLAAPGRMFIPVATGKGGEQKVFVVDKDAEGKVTERAIMDVMVSFSSCAFFGVEVGVIQTF